MFDLADQLHHGPHGAVDAPAAGLEQNHSDQTQHCGGEHHAVKAEGKLRYPQMEQSSMVSPVPGQLEGPQQGDRLPQIPHTGEHQIGVPQHQKEHGEEKGEKSVSERLAFHPFGDVFPAGQPEAPAQQPKQLAPAAVAAKCVGCGKCARECPASVIKIREVEA